MQNWQPGLIIRDDGTYFVPSPFDPHHWRIARETLLTILRAMAR